MVSGWAIRSILFFVCLTLLGALAFHRGVTVPLELARRPALRQDFDTFYFMAKAATEHDRSVLDHAFLRELAERDTGARTIVVVTQPPFSVVPFVPLTFLPLPEARIVWHFLSLLTLLGIFWVLRLDMTSATAAAMVLAGLSFVALFQPLHHHFQNGQTNLLMVLLMAGALALEGSLRKPRPALAGLLLGFAIASKLFPAVVLPVLVARGRWRTVVWTALAITVLIVAALPITGWEDYARYPRHLLDSYYFGSGVGAPHNLSLKRTWLRFLDWATSPPISTILGPAYALPLCWIFFRAWREREASWDSFRLRFWQACLLMSTVMSSSWEYHLLFALGAYARIADHVLRGEIETMGVVAGAGIAFVACSVPTAAVDDVRWMGASLLVWLRSISIVLLVIALERIAWQLAPGERRESLPEAARA